VEEKKEKKKRQEESRVLNVKVSYKYLIMLLFIVGIIDLMYPLI